MSSKAAKFYGAISDGAFFLSTPLSGLAKIPCISVIAAPLASGFNLLGYLSWRAELHYDPEIKAAKAMPADSRITNPKIAGASSYKASSYLGIAAGGLCVASLLVPPLAPINLIAGTIVILASNLLWSHGTYQEYQHDAKHLGETHPMTKKKLHDFSYAFSATVTAACFGLAFAFPPAAVPLLAVGFVNAIIAATSYIKSYKIKKNLQNKKNIKKTTLRTSQPKKNKLESVKNYKKSILFANKSCRCNTNNKRTVASTAVVKKHIIIKPR